MKSLLWLPAFSGIILLLFVAVSPTFSQTADFTATPISGCAPLVVSFSDNSTGTISSYNWNLGNGATPAIQNPSTSYLSPGTYTVSLTVIGPGGSNTVTKTAFITVYARPTVSFAATTALAGCVPHTVQFGSTVTPNQPGSVTYSWDFGDGYSGAGANPVHTYVTAGTYPVSLTVTPGASGCDTTVARNAYITVYPKPSGGFSSSQNAFCSAPATVTFTNTSAGGVGPYTTFWLFGDGGNGSGSPISHTYNTGGNFTVTLIVTDSRGCVDTVINPGYITVVSTVPTYTAPAAACVEAATNFVNTTTSGGGASWDFDDGTTTTGNNVSHTYASSGTYMVQMSVIIGGCPKTITKTIIVNPKPTPTITMSPSIPCPAPVTVFFTGNSPVTAVANYTWSWQSGGTATGQTVTKNYLRNNLGYQMDAVKLITTSGAGCIDSAVMDTIMIRDIITEIGNQSGCAPFDANFSVRLFSHLPPPPPGGGFPAYPLPPNSWSWNFGDGSPTSTSTLATPVHRYLDTGATFTVRCIITTTNGCSDTGYSTVHTDTMVHPAFTATPLTVCTKTPITFINTTSNPLTGTSFNWVLSNGTSDTAVFKRDTGRVKVGFTKPGTYSVFLSSDHSGCGDTAKQLNYFVVNPPGANFTDSVYCSPPSTVKLINTSINATSALWNFGDGTTSTTSSPTHAFPDTGTYNVMLVAYNNVSGCSDTMRKSFTLFKPYIDFIVSDSAICTNDFVVFNAAFTGSGAVFYRWKFDSYLTPYDDTSAIEFQYFTRGYHDVTLYTKSSNGCIDSLKKTRIILVSRPIVNFGAYPPIGCEPMAVLFRDSTTNAPGVNPIIRRWSFGTGDTGINNLSTINYNYRLTGRYTVRLIITDSLQCTDSLIRNNYISVHKPHAVFTVNDDSVCAHVPVLFTSTSTGTAPLGQRWDFGDGSFDTGYFPVHRYAASGLYTVRLVVTDTVGCKDTFTLSRPIYVDAPHAGFTMSDSLAICPPLQVTFTNTSTGAISYLWDFGAGGTPIVAPNPVNTFGTSGLYKVYLVATNINGCTDTARATVRVLGYSGAFTYAPLDGCAPMTVQFSTPITGIPQITWDFDDGNISAGSGTTATHTYPAPGAYVPKVIFSDGHGCSSSSTGLDTIRADKVRANFGWSVPCVGAAFSLYDSSAALFHKPVSWIWRFGGNDTAVGSPVSYTFPTPGNHSVTLIATNATGCKDTIIRDVFINYLPIINVTDDTGVCPGDKVGLVVRGGVNYTWSPAPDSLGNCPICDTGYVHLDTGSTVKFAWYRVTGVDANGCVNKDSVKVSIKYRTDITIGQGGEICVGESFRLHAQGAERYEWMPAETIDSPFIASPLATPQMTTTYIVAAKEGSCDVDSEYVRVVVHSLPLFSAGNDALISLGSTVTLEPTRSGITRIEWRVDTTLTCLDCFRPDARPLYTTTYYATGYNEFGCGSTDSVTVHVRCNGSLVFIPNTFTPNGDGNNDYFFPRGKGIRQMSSFRVYNRWGEVVFERTNVALNDEKAGWDGTFKGRALPPDVYVYTMQSKCSTGEILQWKGDVTLMR